MSKLNISKENYCNTLRALKDFIEEQERASDALEVLTADACFCHIGDALCSYVISLMEKLTFDSSANDDSYLIQWLFYTNDKVVSIDDTELSIETPEELYDFLEYKHK